MLKFSDYAKEEILGKYSMRDEDGNRINTKEDIAKMYNYSIDNVCAIILGFESDDFKQYLYDKIGFKSITVYNESLVEKKTSELVFHQ